MSSQSTRISVAMGTYNGERFLPKQLASILQQTRLPDEMVIGDDVSTDTTFAILQQFAHSAPFPVTLFQNEINLGSTKNFMKVAAMCQGDLIALTDQDDIWYPHRLERSEQELRAHPEAVLVFSDADLIDEASRPLGLKLWQRCGFTSSVQKRLQEGDYLPAVQMRFVTGATVMFRGWLRDAFPVEQGWIHDEWLAAAAPFYGNLAFIQEALIQYRQHAAQQIGPSKNAGLAGRLLKRAQMLVMSDLAQTHWKELERIARITRVLCDRFSAQPISAEGATRLQQYQIYENFQRGRAQLSSSRFRRLRPILRQLPAYARYYSHGGVGSIARDLLFHLVLSNQ